MTTFNTGNPLGSSDPRDLYDNAENLDNLVNGDQQAYNDRRGKSRKSWAGMESEFAAFIAASGYEFVGDYATGIEITGYQQVVRDTNGEFWRASGSTTLPYTTTGAGLPEGGAFVAVGDAVLRQELGGSPAGGKGAALVKGATIYCEMVAEIEALSVPVGTAVYLTEEGRAGEFVVKTGTPPSDPQKGVYIVLANGNYAERQFYDGVDVRWFGAKGAGQDDTAAISAALKSGYSKVLGAPDETHYIAEPLAIPAGITEIDFRGSKFLFDREQGSVSAENSLFYTEDRVLPLKISNAELEYSGTYDFGPSYGGVVNGIEVKTNTEFSGLTITNVSASGFNYSGIRIAFSGVEISDVLVENCRLHHNRVAGCIYGNVDGLVFSNNHCTYNGVEVDAGTGYGVSGSSAGYPKNVIVTNNICSYNWRKGIDFHSGFNITISNNKVYKNRYYGIFVQTKNDLYSDIDKLETGTVIIANNDVLIETNTVDDIDNWGFIYGIIAGSYDSVETETSENETRIVISGNCISVTSDIPETFCIYSSVGNFKLANLLISDNIITSNKCSSLINLFGDSDYSTVKRHDIAILNNRMHCLDLETAIRLRVESTGTLNKLNIEGNSITFDKPLSWPSASVPLDLPGQSARHDALIEIKNNSFDSPTKHTGITFLGGDRLVLMNNTFNGKLERDHINGRTIIHGDVRGLVREDSIRYFNSPVPHIGEVYTSAGFEPEFEWSPSTSYNIGDHVLIQTDKAGEPWVAACAQEGVTGTTEPTLVRSSGQELTDGSVVWVSLGKQPTKAPFGSTT